MKVTLAYGRSGLSVNVPNHTTVIKPTHLERIENDHEAVLPDESVKIAMLTPTKDIEQTLSELLGKYGSEMSIAVLPLGPLTIPYVEE